MKKVIIYTDGACKGNPGPGGWGAFLIYGNNTKEIYGSDPQTTNNKMELQAAIEALSILKETCDVEIYTDSVYLQKGMTEWLETWIKKGYISSKNSKIKNVDLWQKLHNLSNIHKIKWHWVKGHGTNRGNIKADELANKGKNLASESINVL